jgi:hypothetical protein
MPDVTCGAFGMRWAMFSCTPVRCGSDRFSGRVLAVEDADRRQDAVSGVDDVIALEPWPLAEQRSELLNCTPSHLGGVLDALVPPNDGMHLPPPRKGPSTRRLSSSPAH